MSHKIKSEYLHIKHGNFFLNKFMFINNIFKIIYTYGGYI